MVMCESVTYEPIHVCRSLKKVENSYSTNLGLINRKIKQLEDQIENQKRISAQELQSCVDNYKIEREKTSRQHQEGIRRCRGLRLANLQILLDAS